jgi:hypothetical protein
MKRSCPECKRVFDLLNLLDADEFYNGHDCEDLT